jgi:hypothetical protein
MKPYLSFVAQLLHSTDPCTGVRTLSKLTMAQRPLHGPHGEVIYRAMGNGATEVCQFVPIWLYTGVPQHMGMHSHILEHPNLWEYIPI